MTLFGSENLTKIGHCGMVTSSMPPYSVANLVAEVMLVNNLIGHL